MNWQAFYLGCFGVGLVLSLVSFLSGAAHLPSAGEVAPSRQRGTHWLAAFGAYGARRSSPRLNTFSAFQFRGADGFSSMVLAALDFS